MIEEKILTKLESLEKYLSKTESIIPESKEEYEKSFKTQLATERLLQICIEIMIDVSLLLFKLFKLGIPKDEEDIFRKLNPYLKNAETYQEMKRFRNILVHRYEVVNNDLVYFNATHKLEDFFSFIDEVKRILKEKRNKIN
ncbi:MAG: DUF86 domain-containing protein [Candidatus Lokiarchaeota archaeon]|nr:DUF86 domain-containing protein [Candidatus Lokiarchaeota archaeon]